MLTRIPLVRVQALCAATVLAAVGSAVAPAADWPQFRGPHRDGVSKEAGLLARWPEGGPAVLWRAELGEGFSGISVAGGRLYTMFARGGDEYVGCFDAATGEQVWRVRADSKWLDRFGNGPRSTPTVDGNRVYALSANGKLLALGAADGAEAWKKDLSEEYGAKPPQWGVSTSPLVEGGLLLVDVGGKGGTSIVAFDKKTGKEVWRSQDDRSGYSAPLPFVVGGVRQVLFFTASSLVSLSPADGTLRWRVPWKTSWDVNAATPVFIPPDKVFVSSGYDVGAAVYRVKVSGDDADAELVWKSREMKNKFSSSLFHGGYLYGFDEKTLKCVDAETGETKWRYRGLGHGSLIYADGHLIVLGDQGSLVLVEATPEAYREKGRGQPFDAKTWTMPTLAGGKLFLRDEKELLAIDVSG